VFARDQLVRLAYLAAGQKPLSMTDSYRGIGTPASAFTAVCLVVAVIAVGAGLLALRRNGDGPRWVPALAGAGIVTAILLAAFQVASAASGQPVEMYTFS
jgi:hypothetical protein